MRARVICTYGNKRTARAIANALSPDNKASKGISVETSVVEDEVITVVELDGKIETLLATLDDLLSCVTVAECAISGRFFRGAV